MSTVRFGLISDTHGLLRPQALDALRGCDRILHAGDIGSPEVLNGLATIAPVTAIRGNNDAAPWAIELPETRLLHFHGVAIYILHDVKTLPQQHLAEHVDVVIAGHSHRPLIETRDGVLHVNPGSAGRRRFTLPVSVAMLTIEAGAVHAAILTLEV